LDYYDLASYTDFFSWEINPVNLRFFFFFKQWSCSSCYRIHW